MTVETDANFISDFNKAYPRNRDLIKEGDDHIRLMKSVIQNTFPGIDAAVLASAATLNKWNGTFTYEEDTLNINNSFTVKEDKDLDFGENVLSNIGDPVEEGDAVNLRSLQGTLMWPVGSIFMTVDSRNPSVILGFGTWEKFAAGRVIIGTGTTTDLNNETNTFINENKGGSFSKKIAVDNLPAHSHPLDGGFTKSDGAHRHAFEQLQIATPSPDTKHDSRMAQYEMTTYYTQTDGAHKHELEGKTSDSGKGSFMDILPPYISCNIWVRKPDTTT